MGVFVILNASALNCSCVLSVIGKFLNSEKSRFLEPGPRRTIRLALPKVVIGAPRALSTVEGTENAAGIEILVEAWIRDQLGLTQNDVRPIDRGEDRRQRAGQNVRRQSGTQSPDAVDFPPPTTWFTQA